MRSKAEINKLLASIDDTIDDTIDESKDSGGYTMLELKSITKLGEHKLRAWIYKMKENGKLTVHSYRGKDVLGRTIKRYKYKLTF